MYTLVKMYALINFHFDLLRTKVVFVTDLAS